MTTVGPAEVSERGPSTPRASAVLALVIAGGYALAALTAVTSLTWPLKPDHGVFSWVGDVIVRGGMPYRDAWEMKGPFGPYLYAIIEQIVGINQWGARAADQLANLVMLALVWHLTRRLTDAWMAHLAAVLLWMMYLRPGHYDCAQPDTWAGMLVFAAIAVLASPSPARLARGIAAGVLLGLACLNKFFFAAFLLPLFVYEWQDPEASRGERVKRVLAIGASCSAMYAAMMLWFWWKGALADFLEIQFQFNSLVHWSRVSDSIAEMQGIRNGLFDRAVLLLWPLALYGFLDRTSPFKRLKLCLALVVPLNLALYLAQRKYFPYHMTTLFPELVILAVCGIARFRAWWSASKRGVLGSFQLRDLATAGLFVILVGLNFRPELPDACRYLAGKLSRDDYYAKAFHTVRVSPTIVLELSDYIDQHTTPDDTVLVWGLQSEINYLSNRRSPTRFGMNYPLVAVPESDLGQRYRRQFLDQIKHDPPAYILIMDNDRWDLLRQSSKEHFEQFPEFSSFVDENYELADTHSHGMIFRRKKPA